LLLLLGVTVVPFPTALLAAHYNAADRMMATAVFNGTYFAIAIFFNVLWRHAVSANLLDSATAESANAITKQYAVGPMAYLVCLVLTWASAPASLLLNIALAVFFAFPPRVSAEKNRVQMRSATK
jgi:uncharacterized membrane protein